MRLKLKRELYEEQKVKTSNQTNCPKTTSANTRKKTTKTKKRKEQAKKAKTNRKNEDKTEPKRRDLNTKHNKITFSKGNHSDLETSKKMQPENSKLTCQSSPNSEEEQKNLTNISISKRLYILYNALTHHVESSN